MKIDSERENAPISRQGKWFLVHVSLKNDHEADGLIEIPVPLMDSLAGESGDRLDLKALLTRLPGIPPGELVTVEEKDAGVRIWIG